MSCITGILDPRMAIKIKQMPHQRLPNRCDVKTLFLRHPRFSEKPSVCSEREKQNLAFPKNADGAKIKRSHHIGLGDVGHIFGNAFQLNQQTPPHQSC